MNKDGIQTKLHENEFTRLTLKTRGPRRGARDPGSPALGPASRRWRMDQVTPAFGALVQGPRPEQNHLTPTEPRQHYRQDFGACSIDDSTPVAWFPVHGPRRDGSGTTGQV